MQHPPSNTELPNSTEANRHQHTAGSTGRDQRLVSRTKHHLQRLPRPALRQRAKAMTAQVHQVRRDYGRLILVVIVSSFILLAGIPPVVSLFDRIGALEFQRDESRIKYQAALSQKDQMVEDLMESINAPSLLSPRPNADIQNTSIELRWKKGAQDYNVAVAEIAPDGEFDEVSQRAIDPDNGVHQLDVSPGTYAWRSRTGQGELLRIFFFYFSTAAIGGTGARHGTGITRWH